MTSEACYYVVLHLMAFAAAQEYLLHPSNLLVAAAFWSIGAIAAFWIFRPREEQA